MCGSRAETPWPSPSSHPGDRQLPAASPSTDWPDRARGALRTARRSGGTAHQADERRSPLRTTRLPAALEQPVRPAFSPHTTTSIPHASPQTATASPNPSCLAEDKDRKTTASPVPAPPDRPARPSAPRGSRMTSLALPKPALCGSPCCVMDPLLLCPV